MLRYGLVPERKSHLRRLFSPEDLNTRKQSHKHTITTPPSPVSTLLGSPSTTPAPGVGPPAALTRLPARPGALPQRRQLGIAPPRPPRTESVRRRSRFSRKACENRAAARRGAAPPQPPQRPVTQGAAPPFVAPQRPAGSWPPFCGGCCSPTGSGLRTPRGQGTSEAEKRHFFLPFSLLMLIALVGCPSGQAEGLGSTEAHSHGLQQTLPLSAWQCHLSIGGF